MPNANLTIQMFPVTSNVEPGRYIKIVVSDIDSGRDVAHFELLPEHLMDLLGNRQVGGVKGVPAWLIEPERRAVLGMRSFFTQCVFPGSKYKEDSLGRWARSVCSALGATDYQIRPNNSGEYRVGFTHYVRLEDASELQGYAERAQAVLDVVALDAPRIVDTPGR